MQILTGMSDFFFLFLVIPCKYMTQLFECVYETLHYYVSFVLIIFLAFLAV